MGMTVHQAIKLCALLLVLGLVIRMLWSKRK